MVTERTLVNWDTPPDIIQSSPPKVKLDETAREQSSLLEEMLAKVDREEHLKKPKGKK